MLIQPGTSDDFDAVMALLDEAVVWLVEQGRSDQWGSEPWTNLPNVVEKTRQIIDDRRPTTIIRLPKLLPFHSRLRLNS